MPRWPALSGLVLHGRAAELLVGVRGCAELVSRVRMDRPRVRVQLAREAPVGAGDFGAAGALPDPQDLVRVGRTPVGHRPSRSYSRACDLLQYADGLNLSRILSDNQRPCYIHARALSAQADHSG